METVGVIAEYNPFHNGHLLQLREIRRRFPRANIIVAMSGSFTQRGTVAILDKWRRAEAAVRHGVSLVLELPAVFSTRSAQYFASGGVRLFDRLGVVDYLAFGSECDSLTQLQSMSKKVEAAVESSLVKIRLQQGSSYAAALTAAAAPDDLMRQPNVILALEYLRALSRNGSSIVPLPLPRFSADHHEQKLPNENAESIVASASAIRAALAASSAEDERALAAALRAVPGATREMLLQAKAHRFNDTSALLLPALSRLLSDGADHLRSVVGVSEGLEHRLRRAALSARSYDELVKAVRSKRYPRARIRRLLVHLLLGLSAEDAERFDEQGPLYARVLAFNEDGRRLLRRIKKSAEIPTVAKTARFLPMRALESEILSPAQKMLAFDLRATALASLTSAPVGCPPANADFSISPAYIENRLKPL